MSQSVSPITANEAIDTLMPETFPMEWACEWGQDEKGLWNALIYREVRQVFRWIAPGHFMMGSPAAEPERYSDEKQHEVILSQGFWLAETACTQALWRAVMADNPSHLEGDNRPVERVTWNDAQAFIQRLNQAVPGLQSRLPTEAEWEYACRAGTTTPFSFGDSITPEQVSYNGNFPYAGAKPGLNRAATVDVKTLPPNAWGLYEMHGNVREWCEDWYQRHYDEDDAVDPTGPSEGGARVLRGGSWFCYGGIVRSAYRGRNQPGNRDGSTGFRLAQGQKSAGEA